MEKHVPEDLNVHVNENNKKIYLKDFFFQAVKTENVIFLILFLNFNLFHLIVVNFS